MEERVKFCQNEYEKGGEFKVYMDKIAGKGGTYEGKPLNELFKHVIIYDICVYYMEKERKNGGKNGKY